jgi:pilus assembly protein Flp/PilA
MSLLFFKLFVNTRNLLTREEGQDLVEYALLVALIALVAVTGINQVASAVNGVFSTISATLS